MQTITKSIHNATRLNLQRLMMLRSVVMVSLTLVIIGLRQISIPLHVAPLFLAISALGVLNLIAWWQLKKTQYTQAQTLFLQLLGDLCALSVLFYFSGGYSNPFIWMYLLPITVAAVALRPLYAWLIAGISIACYTSLMFYHMPLSHLHLHATGLVKNETPTSVPLDIHLVGMWLGFVVSAIIVAIFIARIGKNLRDYDQKIAEVREISLESERVLALGTQAASAAHELGTPLATMAIISKELAEEYADQPALVAQLAILRAQTLRCKEILSTMTRDAGMARAEAMTQLPLKDFLQQAIQRWQDARPATELIVTITANDFNPTILMDRTLTQAIMNVLDNAADESSMQVLFNAHWDKKNLHIEVRDFGKGLTAEVKAQLGTPFFTSKKNTGMGLGVYLTQLSLARYDGELNLQNHADGGVVTSIKLPIAQLSV